VVEIPTNVPVKRIDQDDEVYRTVAREVPSAITSPRSARPARGQPVLVGTVSIEKSELFPDRSARKRGRPALPGAERPHHEQEARIVAQAGRPGAVTIATNMAGRGTDIQLGGNADMRIGAENRRHAGRPGARGARKRAIRADVAGEKEKALAAGGLYVSAPSATKAAASTTSCAAAPAARAIRAPRSFFLSLEDDLMRIFGSERMDGMLQKLGLKEGEAIIHPWINKALEKAQKKVEARNFDIRKNLLKFDDVMNDQRKVVLRAAHRTDERRQPSPIPWPTCGARSSKPW
jgi:preprotein translocase subunit SecA